MWADTNLTAPRIMREVRPEKVADAVVSVLLGAGEVLVTSGPIRPLLAAAQIVPSAVGRSLRAMGVLETLKERARRAMEKARA
jgi:hypothetical protein